MPDGFTNNDQTQPIHRLSNLRPGESGRVVRLRDGLTGPVRRRLLDLGLVLGTEVTVAFNSPAGNPTAYEIRGALIALRLAEANEIEVERTA